jgi:hypothetical protein
MFYQYNHSMGVWDTIASQHLIYNNCLVKAISLKMTHSELKHVAI